MHWRRGWLKQASGKISPEEGGIGGRRMLLATLHLSWESSDLPSRSVSPEAAWVRDNTIRIFCPGLVRVFYPRDILGRKGAGDNRKQVEAYPSP